MKKVAAIFLFVSLLLPLFASIAHLALFSVNQKEIARTLCIKKSVSGNTCQGKCYLDKKLKAVQDTDSESQEPNTVQKFQKLEYIPFQNAFWVTYDVSLIQSTLFNERVFTLPQGTLNAIFHPPLC